MIKSTLDICLTHKYFFPTIKELKQLFGVHFILDKTIENSFRKFLFLLKISWSIQFGRHVGEDGQKGWIE